MRPFPVIHADTVDIMLNLDLAADPATEVMPERFNAKNTQAAGFLSAMSATDLVWAHLPGSAIIYVTIPSSGFKICNSNVALSTVMIHLSFYHLPFPFLSLR